MNRKEWAGMTYEEQVGHYEARRAARLQNPFGLEGWQVGVIVGMSIITMLLLAATVIVAIYKMAKM